jgi:hypothetical protein
VKEEEKHLAAVRDDETRQKLAIQSTDGDRRVGPYEFTDAFERGLEPGADVRPRPLDQGNQSVADADGQALFGQRTSVTTATSIPAIAPATPFLAASLLNTREKNEDLGSDMRNLQK